MQIKRLKKNLQKKNQLRWNGYYAEYSFIKDKHLTGDMSAIQEYII